MECGEGRQRQRKQVVFVWCWLDLGRVVFSLHLNPFEHGMKSLDKTKDSRRVTFRHHHFFFSAFEVYCKLIFALALMNFKTSLKPLGADQC